MSHRQTVSRSPTRAGLGLDIPFESLFFSSSSSSCSSFQGNFDAMFSDSASSYSQDDSVSPSLSSCESEDIDIDAPLPKPYSSTPGPVRGLVIGAKSVRVLTPPMPSAEEQQADERRLSRLLEAVELGYAAETEAERGSSIRRRARVARCKGPFRPRSVRSTPRVEPPSPEPDNIDGDSEDRETGERPALARLSIPAALRSVSSVWEADYTWALGQGDIDLNNLVSPLEQLERRARSGLGFYSDSDEPSPM